MSKKIDFLKSLQGLNAEELAAKIKEDEGRLKKMQFAHAVTPLENPMGIRTLRKELARLKTLLEQKRQEAR